MACEYCVGGVEGRDSASDHLDQNDVMELASAIALGDLGRSRLALNTLFRADRRAEEWIARAKSRVGSVDIVDALAAKLAAADRLNWNETCALEIEGAPADHCDSSTCIAAYYDDHEPAIARDAYRRYARVALGLPQPMPAQSDTTAATA